MDPIEKRLKDYKGFQIWKVTYNKGLRNEEVSYMINDQEENNCNCVGSLNDARKWVDEYIK